MLNNAKAGAAVRGLLWVVLMVVTATQSIGQTNVVIRGMAVNGQGKRIEMYAYDDMLTKAEHLLDATEIDSTREFRLETYINYPRLVFLQIENYSQSFYVEPGHNYEVYIARFDWDVDEQRNIFLAPEALPLEFVNVENDELNLCIMRFDAAVDSFISNHRVFFDWKYRPQKRYFDTLVQTMQSRFPDGNNEFFNRYKHYTLASMKYAMKFETRKQMAAHFIDGQPIRYHDENYMRLFFDVYANSISKGMARVPKQRLVAWVNATNDSQLLDSIGLDPLLRNEQVRELAVLQAMKEAYHDKDYDQQKVFLMVNKIGANSKFSEHRQIAEHLKKQMRALKKGTDVPQMELPDIDHHMVNLQDMRGKWIYLSFVRVGDPNSLREIETIAHFHDSVCARNKNVEFVSVACDREFQKMHHLLRNNRHGHRYNWTWLHFDGNYRMLEHFGVVCFPTFILINPEGNFHYSVTPAPATGILMHGPWEIKNEPADVGRPFFEHQ